MANSNEYEREINDLVHNVELLRHQAEYKEAENLQLRKDLQKTTSNFAPNETKTLVEYESDNSEVLEKIRHLIISNNITSDDKGNEYWVSPINPDDKIFSESGATLFINMIHMYVNKIQTWSNFKEDVIEQKCQIFFNALADFIYERYDKFLFYQTQDELFTKYKPYIKDFDLSESELWYYCGELKDEQIRNKLAHLEYIFIAVDDLVHANLLRALNGNENAGRRKTTFTSQNIGGPMFVPEQQKTGLFGGRK